MDISSFHKPTAMSRKRKRQGVKRSSTSFKRRAGYYAPRASGDINFVDLSTTTVEFLALGAVQLINGIVPGTAEHQRLGRKVTMKSLKLRCAIQLISGTTPTADDLLRFLVVYDRQSNAAAPTFSDVIASVDAAGNVSNGPWDARNESNRGRFLILRDKQFHGQATASDTAARMGLQTQNALNPTDWVDYIKLKNLEINFNTGTAGTVADITTGSIYVMCAGASAAADNQFQLRMTSRLYFSA